MAREMQDDQWDPDVRRRLRTELRNESVDTHRHRDEITMPDELKKKIKSGDKLYRRVVSTREAAIDSENFRQLSEIAYRQSQATRGELFNFDLTRYKEKLITFMGGRLNSGEEDIILDWTSLGQRAMKAFHVAPSIEFSYGALETVPVRQIVRRAGSRSNRASAIETAKEIHEFDQEEESTTKDVKHIFHHLKLVSQQFGTMEYHKFLVDPSSFHRTVENIFHYSFLVKEGRAGIQRGHDGDPYVFIPSDVDEAGQTTKRTNCQSIVSVSMDKWKEWIDHYNIKHSCIPPREQI